MYHAIFTYTPRLQSSLYIYGGPHLVSNRRRGAMHIADVIKIKYDISPDALFKCIIRDSSNDLSLPLIEISKYAKLNI